MAKKFVKISLATKFRILFGAAVLGIIAAALVVPWYSMELLAQRGVERPAAELTRMRLNEYVLEHARDPEAAASDAESAVVAYYTAAGAEGVPMTGPSFVSLVPHKSPPSLDSPARRAREVFERTAGQDIVVLPAEDTEGKRVYRCFRAVRIESSCADCHRREGVQALPAQTGQLVGMIDLTMPASAASGTLLWWTRGAFIMGAALAALLAFFLFVIITQRLILRPVRQLRHVADRVADGDLTVRNAIRTGDELERLGESFNEMLEAIADQHDKLRAANRALDLNLSELAASNVALDQANQIKSEFLTNISHELRTPLNSIIGFAELLSESEDERVMRYGRNIGASAGNLLGMINDLLDLAKIEAGKTVLNIDKVSVTDTCRTLVTLMKPLADKKHLTLDLKIAGRIPVIETDAGRLQQILYNLLSNAVKFTPAQGQVAVRALADEQSVSISVIDTGPGIAETDQQRIFQKFHQLDRSLTKESAGTGLGLAIARELTALLGGELTLESEPGHGATFTVSLPIAGPRQPQSPPAPAEEPSAPDPDDPPPLQ